MKIKTKTFKQLLCELEGKDFLLFTFDKTFTVEGEFEVWADGIFFKNRFILFDKVIGVQIFDILER